VAGALARVREQIARASARSGREGAPIALVAVTKGVAPEGVEAALAAGHDLFGENRIQEAEGKITRVGAGRWHLVGHLQSNKTRRAAALFDTIHSVDSLELARRLHLLAGETGRRLPVYLQVNVDLDPAKSGFRPADLRGDLATLLGLSSLEPLGLMTVGVFAGDPERARPTFRRLAHLSRELRALDPRLGAGLSMGMSDDFEAAIEEGSTCLRIGRAIFGVR